MADLQRLHALLLRPAVASGEPLRVAFRDQLRATGLALVKDEEKASDRLGPGGGRLRCAGLWRAGTAPASLYARLLRAAADSVSPLSARAPQLKHAGVPLAPHLTVKPA